MDLALAFGGLTYLFKDKSWVGKLLLGAVIALIPIIGWLAIIGWGIEMLRRRANGEEGLPDWGQFGKKIGDGFLMFIILLIYAIPMILTFIPCIGYVIVVLYTLFLVILMYPWIFIQYAMDGFSAAFRWKEFGSYLKENVVELLKAFLVTFVAGIIVGVINMIIWSIFGVGLAGLMAPFASRYSYMGGMGYPPAGGSFLGGVGFFGLVVIFFVYGFLMMYQQSVTGFVYGLLYKSTFLEPEEENE